MSKSACQGSLSLVRPLLDGCLGSYAVLLKASELLHLLSTTPTFGPYLLHREWMLLPPMMWMSLRRGR